MIEPYGITPQQYNVLRILRGAGAEGLPTLSIGERMIEQTPGVTRLVDRLERKGLVERTPCAKDRRRVFCRMTAKGLELLKELDDPVNRWDARSVVCASSVRAGFTDRPARPREGVELLVERHLGRRFPSGPSGLFRSGAPLPRPPDRAGRTIRSRRERPGSGRSRNVG